MTCFYCKGDTIPATTTYTEEVGKSIVIVKNVPCDKCTQCGETFINGNVASRLEEIVDSFKEALTEIAVVSYSAA